MDIDTQSRLEGRTRIRHALICTAIVLIIVIVTYNVSFLLFKIATSVMSIFFLGYAYRDSSD